MRKKIICLTPIKNEEWIIDTFLKTTSVWADHIVILDQNSNDNSLEIIKKYPKTTVIFNESDVYNELDRQRILIKYSREVFGEENILIALDADEILVNFDQNPEWEAIHSLKPGTTLYFPWLNVLPGNTTYFDSAGKVNVFGYIDDGKEHFGSEMHSHRVPSHHDRLPVHMHSVKILHYQFSVPSRQLSKHRWYECLERIKYPDKDAINLYRMYHHIDLIPKQINIIPDEWYRIYDEKLIFLKNISDDNKHWWDKELCSLLMQYGTGNFKKQYIWYVNWNLIFDKYFIGQDRISLGDPRSLFDKLVHMWLKKSQKYPNFLINRVIAKFVRMAKW